MSSGESAEFWIGVIVITLAVGCALMVWAGKNMWWPK